MMQVNFTHYKFIVPDSNSISIDLNTLSGEVEYEITNTKGTEEQFGNSADSNRNNTLIHYGKGSDEGFIFSNKDKSFKSGSIYYLTIKSLVEYSRVILTVSHVGKYSVITESTPRKIKSDGSTKLFYYNVDPTPGNSKIIVELLPSNKNAQFSAFIKTVSIESQMNPNEIAESPTWQLSSNEIIENKDEKLWFETQKNRKTYLSFDINITDKDPNKVVLIAVKTLSDETSDSFVNLYVASSNIQPLKLGVSHFGSVDNKDGVYKIYEAYIPKSQNETYVVELTP